MSPRAHCSPKDFNAALPPSSSLTTNDDDGDGDDDDSYEDEEFDDDEDEAPMLTSVPADSNDSRSLLESVSPKVVCACQNLHTAWHCVTLNCIALRFVSLRKPSLVTHSLVS
jgi:hypothetical protein